MSVIYIITTNMYLTVYTFSVSSKQKKGSLVECKYMHLAYFKLEVYIYNSRERICAMSVYYYASYCAKIYLRKY